MTPQLLPSLFHCFTPWCTKLHFLLACWPDSVDSQLARAHTKNFTREGKSLTSTEVLRCTSRIFCSKDVHYRCPGRGHARGQHRASPLPHPGGTQPRPLSDWGQQPRAWVWGRSPSYTPNLPAPALQTVKSLGLHLPRPLTWLPDLLHFAFCLPTWLQLKSLLLQPGWISQSLLLLALRSSSCFPVLNDPLAISPFWSDAPCRQIFRSLA